MKKIFIVANWKMNPISGIEAKSLFLKINKEIKKEEKVDVIICPPFIYLQEILKEKKYLKIGAQNCYFEEKGAFTGEISFLMLKNLGCEYIILGHSERRHYFKETNRLVAKKIEKSLSSGIKIILCIGETAKEREEKKTAIVLKSQIEESLKNIYFSNFSASNLMVAYEPIWSIGTGNSCAENEAKKSLLIIKKNLKNIFSNDNIKILYGGSVNSENAKGYINSGFDGLLIGGASLKAKEFIKIVKFSKAK